MAFSKSYDAWEQKERAQVKGNPKTLALLKTATNPSATTSDLETLARTELKITKPARERGFIDLLNLWRGMREHMTVVEALAAHPNTPPFILQAIIGATPFTVRAFCANPIAPFLLLEMPGFVSGLEMVTQGALLRDANAPPAFVQALATGGTARTSEIQEAARLHVAFGEAQTQTEWETQLRDYWRQECLETTSKEACLWHANLAEVGLVPRWAAIKAPVVQAEPEPPDWALALIDEWFRFEHLPSSQREIDLLQRIGSTVKKSAILARGLSASATPADMFALLGQPGSREHLVMPALLCHPAVTKEVITVIADGNSPYCAHFLVRQPKTPAEVLDKIALSPSPTLCRMARQHPNYREMDVAFRRDQCLAWLDKNSYLSPFISFVIFLWKTEAFPKPADNSDLARQADTNDWIERLKTALSTPPTSRALTDDTFGRTGRDLLEHLTRDGNRIVRGAAKTRLANSDYRFSLWEAEDDEPDNIDANSHRT